jgi:hypothetical protein
MPWSLGHLRWTLRRNKRRQLDSEYGARSIGAIGCGDRTVHRLDEATTDRESQAGAGAPPIGTADAVELVEDALQVNRRNSRALVHHLQCHAAIVAPGSDRDERSNRCILAGVVEHIEQDLLE